MIKSKRLYTVLAVLVSALTCIYLVLTFVFELDPLFVQMLYGAIYIVVLIIMSFILMCKLRNRFYDFYDEYGCLLRTIFIIQALSLLI